MQNNTRRELCKLLSVGFKNSPKLFTLLLAIMVALGLITPLTIYVQQLIIDNAITYINTSKVIALLLSLILIYFVLYYIDSNSINIVRIIKLTILHKVEKTEMSEHLNRVAKMNYEDFENENTQNVLMRITKQQKTVFSQAVSFYPNIIKRFIELSGIFYFIIKAGVWWAYPLGILASLPSFYFNKQRILHARQVWNKNGTDIRYINYLNDVLLNRESALERRLFNFSHYLSDIWNEKFTRFNKRKIKVFVKSSIATGIAMCFSMMTLLVIGLALLQPLKEGIITLGLYTSILITITSKMNMCISAIVREYSHLSDLKYFINDKEALSKTNNIQVKKSNYKVKAFKSLKFDNVYFSYPNSSDFILKGVSFEIKRNELHALVGVNGAGKTTITKLMLGLYKPTKGKILLNGQDISMFDFKEIQNIFATLQQNFAKYKDSLAQNISLYRIREQEINHSEILKNIKQCQSTELLEKCNNSLDTILSPEFSGGVSLSGGEWQKVALNRALYAGKPFIIFDEPTAALDPIAEIKFYDLYKKIMDNKTCLFITHRLGSSYLFDNCFVLHNGQIVEKGSHHDLIKQSGIYNELYNLQKSWYEQTEVVSNENH